MWLNEIGKKEIKPFFQDIYKIFLEVSGGIHR